jgi:CBS domain containing-hemolysin-like protein
LKSLSFQLSGAQFGITVTALLTGYLAKEIGELVAPALNIPALERFGGEIAATLALTIATLISMLFGELLPKNAALAKPMPIARFAAQWQRGFSTAFGLIIRALNGRWMSPRSTPPPPWRICCGWRRRADTAASRSTSTRSTR